MFVKKFLLASSPFMDAYIHSDFLGRVIFIALILLSAVSWIIILQKILLTYRAKKNSQIFYQEYKTSKSNPLCVDQDKKFENSPFSFLYQILKKQTVDLLNKNRKFIPTTPNSKDNVSYLSPTDIDFVESHLCTAVAHQTKQLEKNLFILSTVVSLGPFLGLLGTVWGILTTFSQLQSQSTGSTHDLVLGGLSLALATTVLGLIDAIPALIGYNYLKNMIKDFQTEMECFSTEILASIEMHYRKVDLT